MTRKKRTPFMICSVTRSGHDWGHGSVIWLSIPTDFPDYHNWYDHQLPMETHCLLLYKFHLYLKPNLIAGGNNQFFQRNWWFFMTAQQAKTCFSVSLKFLKTTFTVTGGTQIMIFQTLKTPFCLHFGWSKQRKTWNWHHVMISELAVIACVFF